MVQFSDNPNFENIIELRDIRQSYDGGKTFMVDNVDFLVENKPEQGQFVVLLGASGCGKSTLLRYIAGLQTPTAGTVLLNGKPVSDTNRAGMVFQQYSSLPWMSVLDNIALPLQFKGVDRKEREERAMEMIKLVGLEKHADKYAQYPNLSGGQLQRVAIARSLLADSSVLLMDEPFGALDVNTRLQMQDLLISLWEKFHSTIVFVTHDLQEAVYLGDDIFVMGGTPAGIREHFYVDLPFHRNRDTKRDPKFIQLVQDLEDRVMQITGGK